MPPKGYTRKDDFKYLSQLNEKLATDKRAENILSMFGYHIGDVIDYENALEIVAYCLTK